MRLTEFFETSLGLQFKSSLKQEELAFLTTGHRNNTDNVISYYPPCQNISELLNRGVQKLLGCSVYNQEDCSITQKLFNTVLGEKIADEYKQTKRSIQRAQRKLRQGFHRASANRIHDSNQLSLLKEELNRLNQNLLLTINCQNSFARIGASR